MPISEVTQLAILQTYSLVLVLSGKTLLAYHLDSLTRDVATPGHVKEFTERNTVEFFITCRQKERDFIIYCTKKGIGSSFTVIEVLVSAHIISKQESF
jgi:hypothetical protein